MDPNVISVTLTPERREKVAGIPRAARLYQPDELRDLWEGAGQGSHPEHDPSTDNTRIDLTRLLDRINDNRLMDHQELYRITNSAHGAILFSDDLEVLGLGEDVGRHNALDKAIGKALLENTLPRASIAALSSRISYELVQKAARADIPIIRQHVETHIPRRRPQPQNEHDAGLHHQGRRSPDLMR